MHTLMGGFHDINDNRQELFETRKSKPTDGMPKDWNLGLIGCSRCRETPKAGISIVDHEIITLLRSFGTLKTKCLTKDWGKNAAGICGLVLMGGFYYQDFQERIDHGTKIWPFDVFVP